MTIKIDGPASMAGPPRRPRGWPARLVLGPPDDPRWARPGLLAVLVLAGFLYCVGLAPQRERERVLRGGGAERDRELEGVLLRLAGFRVVHHRRQAPVRVLGHGHIGAVFGFNSWSLLLPRRPKASPRSPSCTPRSGGASSGLTGERGAHAAG